jgi:hypothetical protein
VSVLTSSVQGGIPTLQYQHAGSKILINGFLTEKIMTSRSDRQNSLMTIDFLGLINKKFNSDRQGCPMSMALFVLFIEPIIRAINHKTSGVIVNNQLMKVFAYVDDVNYILTTDEQSDHISTEITTFMNESQISFSRFINKILFSFHQHARHRLNLLQKVWISNLFVLSKLWYVAQVLPAENKHIGKIRKLLGDFLWRGSLYRIERNQLSLKVYNGGLALINVDLKAKTLFIKNLLTLPNNYIYANSARVGLDRNAREWSQCAVDFDRPNQVATKMI